MPIYEYQCSACNELTEALQKISDDPLTDCPSCGKAALRKKISAVAFRLKGSGWYETDFKSGNKKNLAGDGSQAGNDGGDSGAGKGGETSKAAGSDSGAGKSGSDAGSSAGGSAGKAKSDTSSGSSPA